MSETTETLPTHEQPTGHTKDETPGDKPSTTPAENIKDPEWLNKAIAELLTTALHEPLASLTSLDKEMDKDIKEIQKDIFALKKPYKDVQKIWQEEEDKRLIKEKEKENRNKGKGSAPATEDGPKKPEGEVNKVLDAVKTVKKELNATPSQADLKDLPKTTKVGTVKPDETESDDKTKLMKPVKVDKVAPATPKVHGKKDETPTVDDPKAKVVKKDTSKFDGSKTTRESTEVTGVKGKEPKEPKEVKPPTKVDKTPPAGSQTERAGRTQPTPKPAVKQPDNKDKDVKDKDAKDPLKKDTKDIKDTKKDPKDPKDLKTPAKPPVKDTPKDVAAKDKKELPKTNTKTDLKDPAAAKDTKKDTPKPPAKAEAKEATTKDKKEVVQSDEKAKDDKIVPTTSKTDDSDKTNTVIPKEEDSKPEDKKPAEKTENTVPADSIPKSESQKPDTQQTIVKDEPTKVDSEVKADIPAVEIRMQTSDGENKPHKELTKVTVGDMEHHGQLHTMEETLSPITSLPNSPPPNIIRGNSPDQEPEQEDDELFPATHPEAVVKRASQDNAEEEAAQDNSQDKKSDDDNKEDEDIIPEDDDENRISAQDEEADRVSDKAELENDDENVEQPKENEEEGLKGNDEAATETPKNDDGASEEENKSKQGSLEEKDAINKDRANTVISTAHLDSLAATHIDKVNEIPIKASDNEEAGKIHLESEEKNASKQGSKAVSKTSSRKPSEAVSKPASQKSSKPVSKNVSKPGSKVTSRRPSNSYEKPHIEVTEAAQEEVPEGEGQTSDDHSAMKDSMPTALSHNQGTELDKSINADEFKKGIKEDHSVAMNLDVIDRIDKDMDLSNNEAPLSHDIETLLDYDSEMEINPNDKADPDIDNAVIETATEDGKEASNTKDLLHDIIDSQTSFKKKLETNSKPNGAAKTGAEELEMDDEKDGSFKFSDEDDGGDPNGAAPPEEEFTMSPLGLDTNSQNPANFLLDKVAK